MITQDWKTGNGYPSKDSPFSVWESEFLRRSETALDNRPHFKLDDGVIEAFTGPAIIQIEDDGSLLCGPDETRKNVNRMVIEFQLDQDIEAQLEKARNWLRSNQLARYQSQKQKRRIDKYRNYLRAWDARAVGATHDQIAAVLYPRMQNNLEAFSGRKQVSNDLRAAQKLVDNWFPIRLKRK